MFRIRLQNVGRGLGGDARWKDKAGLLCQDASCSLQLTHFEDLMSVGAGCR